MSARWWCTTHSWDYNICKCGSRHIPLVERCPEPRPSTDEPEDEVCTLTLTHGDATMALVMAWDRKFEQHAEFRTTLFGWAVFCGRIGMPGRTLDEAVRWVGEE